MDNIIKYYKIILIIVIYIFNRNKINFFIKNINLKTINFLKIYRYFYTKIDNIADKILIDIENEDNKECSKCNTQCINKNKSNMQHNIFK